MQGSLIFLQHIFLSEALDFSHALRDLLSSTLLRPAFHSLLDFSWYQDLVPDLIHLRNPHQGHDQALTHQAHWHTEAASGSGTT